jgi:hypothetical protein
VRVAIAGNVITIRADAGFAKFCHSFCLPVSVCEPSARFVHQGDTVEIVVATGNRVSPTRQAET